MMEGPLCKWTNVVKGYQYRYFTLDCNQALLSYYTSKEKMIKGDRRGCVRLKGAVIGIHTEDENTFTITVDQKIFHFKAQDSEERTKWVSSLEDTIFRHTYKKKFLRKLDSKMPDHKEFSKKLNETEVYLAILNDQLKSIDEKIFNSGVEKDEEKLVDIKVKTLTLIDFIRSTITLLKDFSKDNLKVNENEIEKNKNYVEDSTKAEINSLCSDTKINHLDDVSINLNLVPETSYSSSEDEDFFFDAEENSFNNENSVFKKEQKMIKPSSTDLNVSSISQKVDKKMNEKDYDAYYEEDDEDDVVSLEGHGSIISHLISQVKIGMDLTKVVLPTFILERRSLLEMYADFFAHPDLFSSIPDFETPEQRFIQTVRWYLSAFHAGRKSSVAKKPYNPILGETFKCFWNISSNSDKEIKKNEKGPIPWANEDNLCFVAEQVSHHPPISAFYAENVDKRIMCMSYIYTKSKFLGLSIGVQNIGQGSIYLLDKGEEYICTFPSAYGRSILTVPWIELGGNVTVSCEQTGYTANIEFMTKPFYGGKKNRVSGEILDPNKKLIVSITGEWNGIMHAKYSNGKTEVFVNTKELKILKKQVKPIKEQEDFESRRLWREVTAALKEQNVNVATAAKSLIEQNQRDLVKERTEKNIKWKNRFFDFNDGNWCYKHSLTTRSS